MGGEDWWFVGSGFRLEILVGWRLGRAGCGRMGLEVAGEGDVAMNPANVDVRRPHQHAVRGRGDSQQLIANR